MSLKEKLKGCFLPQNKEPGSRAEEIKALEDKNPEAAVLARFLAEKEPQVIARVKASGLDSEEAARTMGNMIDWAIFRGENFEGSRRYSVCISGPSEIAESILSCLLQGNAEFVYKPGIYSAYKVAGLEGVTIETNLLEGGGWEHKVVRDLMPKSEPRAYTAEPMPAAAIAA